MTTVTKTWFSWLKNLPAIIFGVQALCFLAPSTLAQPAAPCQGVIIVVDGSGDSTTVQEHLAGIVLERHLPLVIEDIRWCRWSLPLKDHLDYEGQMMSAQRLAKRVAKHRAANPAQKIYLLGNSSGTHVVLAATAMLPPASVERIVLMATTVSYTYDLRPALRCSRCGIDALFSKDDYVVHWLAEESVTADRKTCRTAGEVGFAAPLPTHPDAPLYKNLRQFQWTPAASWTGHTGGHLGFLNRCFLEAYVMPILLGKG